MEIEQDEACIRIPLRARDGSVRAYALVDRTDEGLARLGWSLAGPGYAARRVCKGRWESLHRRVVGLQRGDKREVDHINGDKLDNRRRNLRVVTRKQNCQNVPGRRRTSEYRGVSWDARTRSWLAKAQISKRQWFLGRFEDEQDAAAAAELFRLLWMPFAVSGRASV